MQLDPTASGYPTDINAIWFYSRTPANTTLQVSNVSINGSPLGTNLGFVNPLNTSFDNVLISGTDLASGIEISGTVRFAWTGNIPQNSNMNFNFKFGNMDCQSSEGTPYCDGTASVNSSTGTSPFSYVWSNGSNIETAENLCTGEHFVSITDADGCTVTASVEVGLESDSSYAGAFEICDGDSLNFGDAFFSAAGNFQQTFINQNGCDSVVSFDLAINANSLFQENITLCAGDSYLLPSGIIANAAGLYTSLLQTAKGCDSTIETDVVVLPTYFFQNMVSICAGETHLLPDGGSADSAGIYVSTLQTTNGCDSVIETTVILNNTYFQTASTEICMGDSIILPSGVKAFSSGVYKDTLQTVQGCDSVIETTLIVRPVQSLAVQASICDNQSYLLPSGISTSQAGIYSDTLSSIYGCDSIIVTDLNVESTFTTNLQETICSNQFYTMPSGQTQNTTGVYVEQLSAVSGCDSVVTVNLQVNPVSFTSLNASICSNQGYFLPSGTEVFQAGMYTDVVANGLGCDSTIEVNLSVLPSVEYVDSISICEGGSLTLPDGTELTNISVSLNYFSNFTASNGCDSTIETIINVLDAPLEGFSVNDTVQVLLNNSFEFTSNETNSNYTFNWNFGDGNTSNAQNPTHSYQEEGVYFVNLNVENSNGCSSSSTVMLAVEQDSISSGEDGGIESKSMEGLISMHNYNKTKNSAPLKFTYNSYPVFSQQNNKKSSRSSGLSSLIPEQLFAGDIAYITSPSHLVAWTNAEEMLAVDYVLQNKTKASILASVSFNEPYNHTKYTCDRFLQGSIVLLEQIEVKGFDFILFGIEKYDGILEYGVQFSAGINDGDFEYDLQSNWLIHEYEKMDSVYNFQVWASNPYSSMKLLTDILENLEARKPVISTQDFEMPKIYVSEVKRVNENIELTIINKTQHATADFKLCEKLNEQVGFDTSVSIISINPMDATEFSFQANDAYEYDAYISVDGKDFDKFYTADANWGLDYDFNFTTVDDFVISNDVTRVFDSNAFPLMRNVHLLANTSDYISIYKDITAGTLPTDISAFLGLRFYAEGSGPLLIRIASSDIENWRDHYKITVQIPEGGGWIEIPFTDFSSDKFTETMPLEKLSTVSFTSVSQSFDYEDVELKLKEVAFVKELKFTGLAANGSLLSDMQVYPNPNNGKFTCGITAAQSGEFELVFSDIYGRVIAKQIVNLQKGYNQLPIDFQKLNFANGMLLINLSDGKNSISGNRVIITK